MRGLFLIVMALVLALAPSSPGMVERYYSREAYPAIQNVLTPLSNRVPFAIFDLLVVLALVGAPVWILWSLASARGRRLRRIFGILWRTAVVGAAVYVAFLALWGLNYRRLPLTQTIDHRPERVTAAALRALAGTTVERLNLLHAATVDRWPALDATPDLLADSFARVQRHLGAERTAAMARPKPTVLTPYFRWSGIDGMTDPFFHEVLVNTDVLPFERPAVVAHEFAHLAGFADEAEANFIGWLTCLHADDRAQYSGWLFLYPHLAWALPEAERQAIASRLGPGPRADLRAIAQRLARTSPHVRLVATRLYDRYLKANRVEAGIESYDLVVRLALGTRFTDGWTPVVSPRGTSRSRERTRDRASR